MWRKSRIVVFSIALALSCVPMVSAQTTLPTASTIDDTRLTKLYEAYLAKNKNDTYTENRIVDERRRINGLIDDEIQAFLNSNEDQLLAGTPIAQSTSKQRSVVSALESSLRGRSVDRDLLLEEEDKYYVSPQIEATVDDIRTTHSYAELLAKKAVLEERISVLNAILPAQKDKLLKLQSEQRLEQFSFLISVSIYMSMLLIIILIERFIQRVFVARIEKRERRYFFKKIITGVIYGGTSLLVLNKILVEHPSILSSLAIIGAGLAVALQDVVKDVVGWMMIVQKRHFTVGDRISIGTYTGDVIDIGILRTALLEVGTTVHADVLERSGKTLFVPNSQVLTQQVLNYNTTSDYTKSEMQITITYESNWQKAEKIIHEILLKETKEFTAAARKQQSKRTYLYYIPVEPSDGIVYTDIASSGVTFTLRFNVPIGFRRDVATKVSKDILKKFGKEKDIQLAYSTVRVVGGAERVR